MKDDFGGIDPPAELIKAHYKERAGNSRECGKCGKMHDTIVEDTRTGERLSELEKCKDCLMFEMMVGLKEKVALMHLVKEGLIREK